VYCPPTAVYLPLNAEDPNCLDRRGRHRERVMPQRLGGSSIVTAGNVDPERTYRRIYWRLIPFLMLCYLFASLDRTNIGYAKLQFMERFGFSEAIYGMGAGLFYLGYLLFEVPSNLLLQRIGVRLTLLRIMIVWGLCCALMSVMATKWQFYGLRFLLGVAEAGFFPGVLYYLTRWAPPSRRARLTAMFMASLALSGIVGGPISGQIMSSMDGLAGLAGWQWLFIVEGLPASLLGIVAYYYLAESPASARWLNAGERALVTAEISQHESTGDQNTRRSFAAVLRLPRFYALAAMSFALTGSTGGLFLWLPTTIRRAGVEDIWTIGLLAAIPFTIGAAVQFIVARSSDRTQERRWHASLAAAMAAAGWAALPFVHGSPALALAAMSVVAAGTLGAMGPFWTLPPTLLPGRALAGIVALVTTAGGFGNFISPIIVGELATSTGSLASGYVYFAIIMLLAAALLPAAFTDPAARA
jgi:MFS family permease